jgi:tetratricopeptide (TPR) repeat protein
LAAAGDFHEAASAWRLVLKARPDDRSALAGLVDALEATGDWRTAIAPLDRLLELGASDPWRLRQRGLYAAWSGDLERGVELLRRAVAQRLHDVASLTALAEVLSWSPATRTEAVATFAAALARDSLSSPLLLGYADLLSWTPTTRDSAAVLYRRVLANSPSEPRARVGLANLQAWKGKPARALRSYDSVLVRLPDDVGALLGRGGALNQLDHPHAALQSLQRALALSPRDASIAGELARAELGTGRFRSARAHLQGRVAPALRGVADSALRATASAAEVSGLVRERKNQLDVRRVTARTTGSVGSLKLYGEYERSELKDGGAGFRSEGYGGGARVDHRGLAVLAAGRMQTVEGLGPRQWNALVNLGWRVAPGFSLQAGASRTPVEESRRAVQGGIDAGQLRGAVHANLAQLTLALDNLPGPFDAEAKVLAGRYTGLGLEPNRRLAADTRVGLVLHRSQPWIRIGYGFAATRFDYNADLGLTQTATQRGGYFSPAEYWHHQGILQVSQRLGSRVRWEADGRMGREWVRQFEGATATARNTAVATSTLTLRLASLLDLEARFLYVNAFDAFELKEFASVLKVYFP